VDDSTAGRTDSFPTPEPEKSTSTGDWLTQRHNLVVKSPVPFVMPPWMIHCYAVLTSPIALVTSIAEFLRTLADVL
jgi:hypothetical protein